MKIKRKGKGTLLLMMVFLLIFVSVFSVSWGDVKIPFRETYSILLRLLKNSILGISEKKGSWDTIIFNIRLPRILAAIAVGMGLSSVGCAYQGIFRNPMADPYILGISSGATLGAAIMIVLGKGTVFSGIGPVTAGAFTGALVTTILVYLIALKDRKIVSATLLLSGVAVSYLISAFVSIILAFSEKNVSRIIYWTMGSLTGLSYRQIFFILPFVIGGSLVIRRYADELDIMSMGEDAAVTMGVDTEKVKRNLLLVSSLVVAVCVSFTGVIGFVGLMVPHAARLIAGPSHRKLIPFSMVTGALFLVISDTVARSLVDSAELPIGAVTAVFGAPYFLWLLAGQGRKK